MKDMDPWIHGSAAGAAARASTAAAAGAASAAAAVCTYQYRPPEGGDRVLGCIRPGG